MSGRKHRSDVEHVVNIQSAVEALNAALKGAIADGLSAIVESEGDDEELAVSVFLSRHYTCR